MIKLNSNLGKCASMFGRIDSNSWRIEIFVIFIIQMFVSSQKSVEQKLLKDANFLSVYVYAYKCMIVWICLHASGGRCAKTELSSYWSCETKNKRCGSCILTTKRVTQTKWISSQSNLTFFPHKCILYYLLRRLAILQSNFFPLVKIAQTKQRELKREKKQS